MASAMKLYSHALAPNPRRVRIFAAEKGIELALQDIDILAGQSRTPELLAKNSSGGVPVLELDDGSCLAESVAICRYLGGASSRAKPVRARLARAGADRDVEPADGTGAVRRYRTHSSKYEPDLSRSFQAIPGLRRSAACGRPSTTRTDGSRAERTAVCRWRPFHDRRHHRAGRNRHRRSCGRHKNSFGARQLDPLA